MTLLKFASFKDVKRTMAMGKSFGVDMTAIIAKLEPLGDVRAVIEVDETVDGTIQTTRMEIGTLTTK